MATDQEKQELVEVLKFTPRTYKLSLWGYGGEIAIGRLNEAQYEYWKDKEEADIIEHCTSWLDEGEKNPVPEEARFCNDGSWYDTEGHLDSMSGCEFSDSNHIQIEDEKGETVFDEGLSCENLEEKHKVQLKQSETYASDWDDVDGYFCFQSTEKGTFFSADLHLKAPFDPSKLKIHTVDFEGWELITGVDYDGEELEGFDGYDTTGKGYYASINLT